jgi:hypothetical protein
MALGHPMNPLIPTIISTVLRAMEPAADVPPQPAFAGLRPIPAEAVKARMSPPQDGWVEIGGRPARLAPGAQIRDAGNFIVMSGTVQQPVQVRYLLDDSGAVSRVWILSAQEAAAQ